MKIPRNELLRRWPNASQSFIAANSYDDQVQSPVQSPKPERPVLSPLAFHSLSKAESAGRVIVRVKAMRKRLLDEDNHVIKFLVDGLREAGIIPNDSPDKVHIEFSQEKAKDDWTEIEIIYPS